MSRFDRQLAAAQRQYDSMSPDEYDDAEWEAREEYITDNAPEAAKLLMVSPDFAWSAMADLNNEVLASFAEDLGAFFERYHAGTTDADLANAGYRLYRTLRPYVEAAAEAQAMRDLAEAYDRKRDQDDMPRSAAEYARELAA